MHADSRIFVAGHRGLVGGAIVRRLQAEGFNALILRGRDQVDLTDAEQSKRCSTTSGPRSCSSRRPRSAASTPTTPTPPSSCWKTCRSRTTS